MRLSTKFAAAFAAAASLVLAGGLVRGGDDVRTVRRAPRRSGADRDIGVRLSHPRETSDGVRVWITLRNRGRADERGVRVALWCDGAPEAPLWSIVTRLRAGASRTWSIDVDPPEGATEMHAVALLADGVTDGAPDDNASSRALAAGAGDAARGAALWSQACGACHGAYGRGGTHPADVSASTAATVFAVAWAEGATAHRSSATTWQDALDLTAHLRTPPPPPDPPKPPPPPPPPPEPEPCADPPVSATYDADIEPFIAANCLRCHVEPNPPRDVHLSTYEALVPQAAHLLETIELGFMPADAVLSACDVALFRAWVESGTPR